MSKDGISNDNIRKHLDAVYGEKTATRALELFDIVAPMG
jgi:hypothetical protein